MKLALFLPALAVLGLSGCVTGYGYSDDGYYYGRPEASVGSYGSIGYGSPGGWRYGYGMGYGSPGYYGYYDPYRCRAYAPYAPAYYGYSPSYYPSTSLYFGFGGGYRGGHGGGYHGVGHRGGGRGHR